MARYGAAQNTLAAEVANIDVVEVGQRVIASAYLSSAFMPIVNTFRAPSRQGILAQEGAMTWAAGNLDTTVSTEPDETAYTPTGRTYACTGHIVDAVIGQYALADGNTSGKPLIDQIVDAATLGYVKYFDGLCAALYTEAPSSGPDHEIGASTAALTGPLVDQGLALLLAAGAPEKFALVIHSTKVPELMQIPHMRDRAIRGAGGAGAVDLKLQGVSSRKIVEGYGGSLDVYQSDQIVSSTGYHNIMMAVGDGSNSAIANPWFPIQTPNGLQGQKLFIDVAWESARRAIEVNATTMETVLGSGFSSTTNKWMVDIVTA